MEAHGEENGKGKAVEQQPGAPTRADCMASLQDVKQRKEEEASISAKMIELQKAADDAKEVAKVFWALYSRSVTVVDFR